MAAALPTTWLVHAGAFAPAFWVFAIAGASDAVDGFIAKRFGRRTTFGTWLDPLADKVLLTGVYVGLTTAGLLPGWLLALVLTRDLGLVVGALALARAGAGDRVRPSLLGKLNTVAQVALAAAVLAQAAGLAELAEPARVLVWTVAVTTLASALGYALGLRRPDQPGVTA